jgi:hypothetical protein
VKRVAGLALVVTLGFGACTAGAQAATVTFGADLSALPTASFHCSVPPPFYGPYRPPSPYAFPPTCTALTAGNFGGGGMGSHLVPQGVGVITKIRVKEPPTNYDSAAGSTFGPAGPLGQSGPLKISLLQALRSPQSSVAVCCTVQAETAPFTPAMRPFTDTITEVTLNPPLRVHAVTTVTGVYEFQGISVSAVRADSIIPAGRSSTASSGGYYPAVVPGQERNEQQTSFGSADGVNQGTQIMLQADWTEVPAVTVGTRTLPVSAGNAAMQVLCNLFGAPCTGGVSLTSLGSAAAKRKTVSYGSAKLNIPAGKSRRIKIRLSSAGRALMRRHRSASVHAIVTVGGKRVASQKVLLKR